MSTTTDNRSVHTDALDTLGSVIDSTAERDAIHLAVEPLVARVPLFPGQHIGIIDGKATTSGACKKLGIVDPFLTGRVEPGETFWMIIYPRTITSLRHVWSHPDFEEKVEQLPQAEHITILSEEWLREFCATNDAPDYDTMIELVKKGDYGDDGYFFVREQDAHCSIPAEFWDHVEAVLGRRVMPKPDHFSCSC